MELKILQYEVDQKKTETIWEQIKKDSADLSSAKISLNHSRISAQNVKKLSPHSTVPPKKF